MRHALCACLLLLAAGCTGIPARAARDFYNAVTPRFTKSVNEDARLNADQKRVRLQAVESFDRLLNQAEK